MAKALRQEEAESNKTDHDHARVKTQAQKVGADWSAPQAQSIRTGQHKQTYLLALDVISPEARGEAQVFGQRIERLGFLVKKPHLGRKSMSGRMLLPQAGEICRRYLQSSPMESQDSAQKAPANLSIFGNCCHLLKGE